MTVSLKPDSHAPGGVTLPSSSADEAGAAVSRFALADTEAELERVRLYLDSGRGPRKIEAEALDPRDLRARVIAAIESTLDLDALEAVREQAEDERQTLGSSLEEIGRGRLLSIASY
jgi:hypothetical protein